MPAPRNVLGISAYYHDAAAALVRDGKIIAAAQEERFTRKKNDPDFPRQAVAILPAPRRTCSRRNWMRWCFTTSRS